MTDMLEKMRAAKATLDGADDNLCQALIMLATHGHVTIIPQDERVTPKPVIIVPERLYRRIQQLVPTRDATYEACRVCGEDSHTEEAACLHCGASKEWAK